MTENGEPKQATIDTASETPSRDSFRFVLYPHRSLSPTGFLILMTVFGGVSFIAGMAFLLKGAWPVFGFFGLDVALLYLALRLNYRSGRLYETIDLTTQTLTVTRVHPTGRKESFDFNPYWVRVHLAEGPQGRTDLRLASHGREFSFGNFLTDDERREVSATLAGALTTTRAARP